MALHNPAFPDPASGRSSCIRAVRGRVDGNLVAEDRVELGPEASLDGDIVWASVPARETPET